MHPADVNVAMSLFVNTTALPLLDSLYPPAKFSSTDKRVAAMLRDLFFACSARTLARTLDQLEVPVWLYQVLALHDCGLCRL